MLWLRGSWEERKIKNYVSAHKELNLKSVSIKLNADMLMVFLLMAFSNELCEHISFIIKKLIYKCPWNTNCFSS